MIPFLLVGLGLILILIEFYIPGAIIGIIGGICILIGAFLFASQSDSLISTLLFITAIAVSIGYVVKFALWRIAHTPPKYSIYSNDDQEGYVASSYDKEAIGKTGIVLADLKPGGYILIDGQQHAAISLEGYIVKGESVHVVSGQEQSLLVTLSKKDK